MRYITVAIVALAIFSLLVMSGCVPGGG